MGIGLELQTKSRHLVNEHPQYIQHRMARSYQRISRTWSCRAGALDANKLRHIDEAIEQKQLNKQHVMNFTIPNPTIALASVAILFSACGKTDTEQPSVCTEPGTEMSVLVDEIEALAGNTIQITDLFCDNEGLSEVRWDIHNAADHAHEEGESDEGFVLHSGTEWEVLEVNSISGTSSTNSITLDIPLDTRGVWDVVVSLVDEAGNAAADLVTQLHIENEYIPEFTLTTVNGIDPATWSGEPLWNVGSVIALSGMVADSDGLSTAHISFVRESDETIIWELNLEPNNSTERSFDSELELAADAIAGEYHLEMTATDAAGNAMETGFHVEVE
jgi:hypothetical protein